MKTLFQNLNQNYQNLSNYPKIVLKINHLLSSLKIKVIEHPTDVYHNEEELIKDKLTIVLCPKLNTDNRIRLDGNVESALMSRGHRITKHSVSQSIKCKNIKLKINWEGNDREFVAGKYLINWNTIILYFNLFECNWSEYSNETLGLIDQFNDQVKKLKLKTVDTKEEIERLKIEIFMKHAKKALNEISSCIQVEEAQLKEAYQHVAKRNRQIEVYNIQRGVLTKFMHTGEKQIINQVKEIKSLPFVKDIQVTFDGIMVYIGQVNLDYKKKKINLGRFRIYLQPEKISVINLDAIRRSGDNYDSPHVHGGNPCYGGWGDKISELLARLEFKKIIFLIKLILQKYNPESPHIKLADWNGLRKFQPLRLKDALPEIGISKDREYNNKLRSEDAKKNGTKYEVPGFEEEDEDSVREEDRYYNPED